MVIYDLLFMIQNLIEKLLDFQLGINDKELISMYTIDLKQ